MPKKHTKRHKKTTRNPYIPEAPKPKREKKPKDYDHLPLFSYIFFGIFLLALTFYIIAAVSETFANAFNGSVGAFVRGTMARLTSWIPFSLAEFVLYSLPLLVIGLAIYAYRCRCESWRTVFVFLGTVVSVFSLLFSLFAFGFGTGYHTDTLDRRMGMTVGEVTKADLLTTARWLVDEMNELADEVTYGENGASQMPYDRKAMNDLLIAAYEPVCEQYPFIQRLDSNVKPVLAGKLMSYTHVTGVYAYFTGEANINTHFPDYTIPFTAAHELAHQRGMARENEANFVAFLVTAASEDPYIRYSGYVNLFEYVAGALYTASPEDYKLLLEQVDERIMGEFRAYSAFFDAYRDAGMAQVSNKVNDVYLKLNGNAAGVDSYGLVVELAVSYCRTH